MAYLVYFVTCMTSSNMLLSLLSPILPLNKIYSSHKPWKYLFKVAEWNLGWFMRKPC
jgi:hypothetical protein